MLCAFVPFTAASDVYKRQALKDIVIEWKGNKAEDIANEIKNRIDCYCSSDRESSKEEQTEVRDNIFKIQDVLNAL